jgi:hypothetical protein
VPGDATGGFSFAPDRLASNAKTVASALGANRNELMQRAALSDTWRMTFSSVALSLKNTDLGSILAKFVGQIMG